MIIKRYTTERFISRAREIHGNRYDYSLVNYKKCREKIKIICPIHGIFLQSPNAHLSGRGCPKCAGMVLDTASFISKAQSIHGNRYDYSLVNYINSSKKVIIICPVHGEFLQNPNSHLKGHGCPSCGHEQKAFKQRSSIEEFISRARSIHGNKYDYSLVNYTNTKSKVTIICPEHGPFVQVAGAHLRGRKCKHCADEELKIGKQEFISRVQSVHGDKYDYSLVNYINSKTKVTIICPSHGEFSQSPDMHLAGHGCPICGKPSSNTIIVTNKEKFISKARSVHKNKYDYSLANYINSKTKITIICPFHGEFLQSPSVHLRGSGCPKCAKIKRAQKRVLSTKEFIKRARFIHGDKYDYSKTNYSYHENKVIIICPTHGEFSQTATAHLSGYGCPHCGGSYKSNRLRFISKARSVHGNKYNYSLVDYINSKTKVTITCPSHGEFLQTPSEHLKGRGCPQCAKEQSPEQLKSITDKYIVRSKQIHHDKYDYSLVDYLNVLNKVTIICPIHGPFSQSMQDHSRGQECPKCAREKGSQTKRLSTKEFISRAQSVHGDKYDYSLVNYKDHLERITIICPKHGAFEQMPHNHLAGRGCPICPRPISSGHQEVIDYIKSIYGGEIIINDRKAIAPQELDIYLPKLNLGVEFNGTYWHSLLDPLYHQQKHLLCLKKGILLIQIDEHLWKRNRAKMQNIIYNKIKNVDVDISSNSKKLVIDARYDNGKKLIERGYKVKLCKPRKHKIGHLIVYDAGRYLATRV